MRYGIRIFLLFSLILTFNSQPAAAKVLPATPNLADTPTTLVNGGVNTYYLSNPKLFWHTSVPTCPPIAPIEESSTALAASPEQIARISIYGSTQYVLYYEMRECSTGQILSNIVADDNYIYFLTAAGLMRLSTNAGVGDDPEIMNNLVNGYGELAIDDDQIFYIFTNGATKTVGFVWKPSKIRVNQQTPGNAYDLQTDGQYVYYKVGGTLYRLDPAHNSVVTVANGVTGYHPEGERTICAAPGQCFTTDYLFLGQGRSVYIYDNVTKTRSDLPIYTSSNTTASIIELVATFNRVLFLERIETNCSPICSYTTYINRMSRNGQNPATLYTYGPVPGDWLTDLSNDGTYLYFKQLDTLRKIANNAEALPSVDMWITGMEVTQGIQSKTNAVPLIKGRRTFVRVYVASQSQSVDGVTAILEAPGISSDILVPVNPAGTRIKVNPTTYRDDINQSFLFELPWNWVSGSTLSLKATLNPYRVPIEPDYTDNTYTSPTLNLLNSPTLSLEVFRLTYDIGGTIYSPREDKDVQQTFSYIMRLYPVGGVIGDKFKPHMVTLDGGAVLGSLVDQSNPLCQALTPILNEQDPSLCASYIANSWLFSYRIDAMVNPALGVNPTAFYYGMISDGAGFFPRGQAAAPMTSVGPAGPNSSWDLDGSYADWYAAHELGHSLGRKHPWSGSDHPLLSGVQNCGHDAKDFTYPYGQLLGSTTPIGPDNGDYEGFDFGDSAFGISMSVKPSSIWNDVMSYCDNLWISDYTYMNLYSYMLVHPSSVTSTQTQSGDFLAFSGLINPDSGAGGFSLLRRIENVVNVPALVPGDYALRFRGLTGNLLAEYAFTPEETNELGLRSFAQVVPYAFGTRQIELVNLSNGVVINTAPVSASIPVVSGVALQGAPDPVSGVVTLVWNASDADSSDLTFDIFYSNDNGLTYRPTALNKTGTSAQIDTSTLPGSPTGRFRVVASDGINTGVATSTNFVMADKPPQPMILTPQDNLHIQWGQLVNLEGVGYDILDGTVPSSSLIWRLNGRILGFGARLSTDGLPIGENTITLRATNSAGISANTSITVFVNDDLDLPGANLSVGPSQIGWHIANAASGLQTAQISITNTGSGNLTWSAVDDAPWLSLSQSSGTVAFDGNPSTLTLTANPLGLRIGTTYTARLVITKPATTGSPLQQITIPISLSLGPVYFMNGGSPPYRFNFLPIIRR